MDEYLWPARHVAEYAYCPRLFYLMEVEGVYYPNAETEKGKAVHQRVDKPSAAGNGTKTDDQDAESDALPADPDKPKTVRSLALTSRKLGLTATLDIAEINGNVAVPVEYRKGRPQYTAPLAPDDSGESDPGTARLAAAWPTDRVQAGLQAILLEEAGYEVPNVTLYYAAERRRIELPVMDDLRQEALATLQAARTCADGPRPAPLVNDAKCPRCSLQPFCLPDEVNFERTNAVSPRKLWPPRDDAIHLVAQRDGVHIGVRGMALRVTDKDGKLAREIPLANLESLGVLGGVQVSTQALTALAGQNIPVAFLSSAGRLITMTDPMNPVSALIRAAQARTFCEPAAALKLSRSLVAAKISNQRTILMRNRKYLDPRAADDMRMLAERAAACGSAESLLGLEGQAAAIYFGNFGGIFSPPFSELFQANGRQRRPPPDPLNAVLSWGYTMLVHESISALRLAGLEPMLGAFHKPRPGKPALALDLMEPFRPLIADSIAISTINRGELTEGHFLQTAAGCTLTDAGRGAFFGAWGRRMDTEVTHPVFEYRLSYRRMMMLHARMISAWLVGDIATLSFLTTR
jgi:CRISPR-associated endonuclease Cas1/CRISPR-associated protein Cas4